MTKRGLIRVAAWLPALLILGFALLRASGLDTGYPLYPLLAFTPYAALVGLLAVIWAALLRERWAACAALAGVLVLAALVVPRLLPGDGRAESPPPDPLRVMSVNLAIGRADIDRIAELARDQAVDVIAFQELTPDALEALADSALGDEMRHSVLDAREGPFGIGTISRKALEALPQPELSPDKPAVAALVAFPGAPGGSIEVWNVHPPPPVDPAGVAELRRYLEAIPAPDPDGPPRLLLGDFNSTLDHPNFQAVLDRGYRDAADALGEGLAPTWPNDGFPPGVVIDHALGDERIEFSDYSVHDVPGSDHKAVVVSLSLDP